MHNALFCHAPGPVTTPSPYSTPSPRLHLQTELRFAVRLTVSLIWKADMMVPNSGSFRQAAHRISQVLDAAFVNSDIGALYAYSKVKVLWEANGDVQAYLEIYLYIDYNPIYHTVYQMLSNGTTFITEQFHLGFDRIPPPPFSFLAIVFLLPRENMPELDCPEWTALWGMVYDVCTPSLIALVAAPSNDTLCRHYISSLKCASLVAKARFYHCDVEELKDTALNDTWVFTGHYMGYHVPQQCSDEQIELMADLNQISVCQSPDAYLYIADYICKDHWTGGQNPHHTSPYPHGSSPHNTGYWTTPMTTSDQTGYWTTSNNPSGSSSSYQTGYWTTSNNPSGSSGSYQTGYWTTSNNPSGSSSSYQTGYWTTSNNPSGSSGSHQTGYWSTTQTWHDSWSTFSTGMPSAGENPCRGFAQRSECIFHTLTSWGPACPMDTFYQTLIQYNETILHDDVTQCEEDSQKILSDECFEQDAVGRCLGGTVFTAYIPDHVCIWWYREAVECVSSQVDKAKCPVWTVDRLWRRYLVLLANLRHTSPVFQNLNIPLIDSVLHCSTDYSQYKKKECPSFTDVMSLSSAKCFPIFASLVSPNSSLSNLPLPGVVFGDTAHTPHTLQERCQLYGDLLRCLSLALHEDHECDTHDLQEGAEENSNIIFEVFGFYPEQCSDSVPDKLTAVDDVCKNTDVYELLAHYYCSHAFNVSAGDGMKASECIEFFGGVSCLARGVSQMMSYTQCSDGDVMSVLNSPANSSLLSSIRANFSSCLNRTMVVGRRGEVLMRHGNRWTTVCSLGWGSQEATVVCSHLGFLYGHAFNRSTNGHIIDGVGPVQSGFTYYDCDGGESSLKNCSHHAYPYCTMYGQPAAVACSNVELTYELVPDKPGVHYGYVNLTRDGGTGLICSPFIHETVAPSLCRAAGYENGGTIYPFGLDPPTQGKVWRNFLYCDGPSVDVESCVHDAWQFGPAVRANNSDGMLMGYPCDGLHGNLVRVFCFHSPLKLHTGLFNSSGIAEIFKPGMDSIQQAFPFCDSGFDNFTADLFCKEIGFVQGGVVWSYKRYDYDGYYMHYQVNCTGQEDMFTNCSITQASFCEDIAAVRCYHDREDGVADLDVRLHHSYDGSSRYLVLVYYHGEWGTICADAWTEAEANTVCRSLGYEGGFSGGKNRGKYLPHLLHNITCNITSSSLQDCDVTPLTSHSLQSCRYTDAAAVTCYNTEDLAEYRLQGGPTNTSGFVLVTYNNTEGLLCADLGTVHYNILCRSLGFFSGERYPAEMPLPDVDPVWTTYFTWNCPDDAHSLESCREARWHRNDYYPAQSANDSVTSKPYCYGGFATAFCYSGVKLNTGFQNQTGVVEVYVHGKYPKYQAVCLEGLTDAVLDVVCQQATGLSAARASLLSSTLFPGLPNHGAVLLNASCVESGQAVDSCVEKETHCGLDQLAAVHCYVGAESHDIGDQKVGPNGVVLVKKYGTFGTVCRDKFNDTVANLFCQSVGYFGGFPTSHFGYPDGRRPMWVDSVTCPQGASQFSECTVTHATNSTQCFTQAAASVRCYTKEEYEMTPLPTSCPDWTTVWQRVYHPCMLSIDAAKYSNYDRCSHYGDFLKCAAFVLFTMDYPCLEHDLQQLAHNHFWYFHTAGSDTSSSGYYGSGGSSWDSSASSSDYYGSGASSWDSSTSSSDYYETTSSSVYPSYSDATSGGSSSQHDSSSGYGASTTHTSGGYNNWYETSLPAICKDYVAPSLVDMEKTDPCANPDAYVYMVKYHCHDAYYSSTPASQPSASHFFSGSSYDSSSESHSHSSGSQPGSTSGTFFDTSSATPGSAWSSFTPTGSAFTNSGSESASSSTGSASASWSGSSSTGSGSASWSGSWSSSGPSASHSHSADDESSAGHTSSPHYTSPQPAAPQNACRTLAQKLRCIRQHLQSLGLTCPASTIRYTADQYKHAVLTTEVHMCSDFLRDLEKDECFQSVISDTSSCLSHLHDVPMYDRECSYFQLAVQCSIQKYPGKCRRDNAAVILRQWLSVEHDLKNSSDSLGISISDYSKENIFRCPYYQAREGCPTYQMLTDMSGRAISSIVANTNISTNLTTFCRMYEDVLAASMLKTAEYPNCSVEDLHQLYLDNDDDINKAFGFSFTQCAGQLTLPQVDKSQDLCVNSYFIRFLAGGQKPCGHTSLSALVDPTDAYRRSYDALRCYFRNASAFLPASLNCSRDAIIQGLKANPQYLHSSFEIYLDSPVMLTADGTVLIRPGSHWSTVCRTGWDHADAVVVCRALGYNIAYSTRRYDHDMISDGIFGILAKGAIFNLNCSGDESSPLNCSYEKGYHCQGVAGAACYMSEPVYEIVSDREDSVYGNVRRSVDGRSGYVASHWTNQEAATLLCKAANFSHGGILFRGHLPDVDMGWFRWNTDLSCSEEDVSIEQCAPRWTYESVEMVHEHSNGSVSYVQSDYLRPVKVFCFLSNVRLHNSLLNSTGIAQVVSEPDQDKDYEKQQYLGICREGFTNFTASLFCKALGHGFQSGLALGYQPFRFSMDMSRYFNVSCNGSETEFQQCHNSTVSDYDHHCSAGLAVVSCRPSLDTGGEAVADLTPRLAADGQTVLIHRNGQWGYICDTHWTDAEAGRVCNTLNFTHGIARHKWVDSTFRPFFIHNVSCAEAASWEDCSHQDVDSDVCINQYPAGVFCYNQSDLPVYTLYNEDDANATYGWVHVTRDGSRGRLCAYGNQETFFTMLCRHLGFIDGEEYRGGLPQDSDLPYWSTTYDYQCDPDSAVLEACSTGWEKGETFMYTDSVNGSSTVVAEPYCMYTEVKAFCYGSAARVHSGYFNTSGILEVAVSQTYRHVCAERDTYNQEAANVICHSLTRNLSSSGLRVRRNVFMYTAKPTVRVRFSCDGSEEDLEECMTIISDTGNDTNNDYINTECGYGDTMVAVVCYEGQEPIENITEWLIGVDDSVLVKRFGLWGHVCSPTWTNDEAATVCRTLGHDSGVFMTGDAWGTKLAQWVSSMSCPPDAAGVWNCSVTLRDYSIPQTPDYTSCFARRAKCFDQSDVPILFFADNNTLSMPHPQGLVAVTYRGVTGYFCSSSVSSTESYSVLCRLMGFPRGGQKLDSLPKLDPDLKGWTAQLTCGQWDRNLHPVSCFSDWHLKDVTDTQSGGHSGGNLGSLSYCGRHVPAVTCLQSEDYRLVSEKTDQGILVMWNSMEERWEKVCRDGFTDEAADAACHELGYSEGGHMISEGDTPEMYYTMADVQFLCSGEAGETLSGCPTSASNSTYSCSDYDPAVWLSCISVP